MNFGQNYFDVLTSRFGGASSIWNRQSAWRLWRLFFTTFIHVFKLVLIILADMRKRGNFI